MKRQTIDALRAINRRFYEAEATSFAQHRTTPWAGWARICSRVQNSPPLRVLDLGCGHGRFLEYLRAREIEIAYRGVDESRALLNQAASRFAGENPSVRWEEADLLGDEIWPACTGAFDLVALWGVLHHVPSVAARRSLIMRASACVAPGGLLALSVWRFLERKAAANKIVPWGREPGVMVSDLERGDFLLSWGRSTNPRYCHDISRDEQIDWQSQLAKTHNLLEAFEEPDTETPMNTYWVYRCSGNA